MRIGIDSDGVLYTFQTALIRWLKESGQYDNYKVKHRFDEWYFYREWGMTDAEFISHVADGVAAGVIFRGPARKGASSALKRLQAAGHTLHIITDRNFAGAQEATIEWLAQHNIPYDTLTFSADKTIIPTDVFIEDKPENADALAAAGTKVYLVTRAWNRHAQGHERVSSISEFADKVLELS
jgi:5'(3')-deoxyribonucleotidase